MKIVHRDLNPSHILLNNSDFNNQPIIL